MPKVELDGIIFAKQHYGGVSSYHRNLVHHSSPKISYLINILGKLVTREKLPNFSNETHNNLGKFRNDINVSIELLKEHRTDPSFKAEVVHSTYYRTVKQKTTPLVITAHDCIPEVFGVKTIRQYFHVRMKQIALTQAEKIIAISENTILDIEKFYGSKIARKATVIPHGVSEDFSFDRTQHRERRILFVGLRDHYKNFSTAVDIAANIPSMQLRIIGGKNLSKIELFELEKKLPGRYLYLGKISQTDLINEYNRAQFLIYPSLYEGFGLPPVEAARCGCIPIVFDTSSLNEVVGTTDTIFPVSTNPLEIADALSSLSDYELEQYRNIGLAFTENFSWRNCAAATEKLYNSL